jgi:ketosteroid isomerase-like protein
MRHAAHRTASWIVLLVIAIAACAPATASHDLTETDLADIRAVWDAVEASDLASDWATTQGYLTSDFVHLDPRTAPLLGSEAWLEWVESMDFSDVQGTYTVEEVAGSGDLAYVRWSVTGSWMEGGELVETQGKGLSLFKRMPDGLWKMSRNAWNATP